MTRRPWQTLILQLPVLLVFLAFLLPTPISAQTPPPELILETAWDGWYAYPGWVEVQATLTNEGGDWEGELSFLDVSSEVTYRQPLVLPAHSRKFYRIPVYAHNVLYLRAVLRGAGGKTLAGQAIELYNPSHNRVCAVADATGLVTAKMLQECGVVLLIQDLARLPETPMAWDALSILILNGVSTSELTPAQQESLLAWVGVGGHLILSGGGALPQTLAGLPQPLRIVTPGTVQSFDDLDLSGEIFDGVAATPLTLSATATPLLTVDKAHLAARQVVGLGEVDVVGWDIIQTPGFDWLQTLWADDPASIQIPLTQNPTTIPPVYGNTSIVHHLLQAPRDAFPILRWWAPVILIYVLALGPGTWFAVRRLRRPSLAWPIIFGWIAFSLAAMSFLLGGQFEQVFPLTHQIAYIFAPGNGLPARATQGNAMYAPRSLKFSWEMDGASRWLAGKYLSDGGYYGNDPYPLDIRNLAGADRLETAHALGVITWGSDEVVALPPLIADFKVEAQSAYKPVLSGTLRSEMALAEVSLFLGEGRYIVELTKSLEPGVPLDIYQTMTQTRLTYTGFNTACRDSADAGSWSTALLVVHPFNPSFYAEQLRGASCYIAGMTQSVPFPLTGVGGTRIAESCILYTVPCPIQVYSNTAGAALPPVVAQVEGGWMDPASTVYFTSTDTIVPFAIPDGLHLQSVQSLTLRIQPPPLSTDSAFNPQTFIAALALWDWAGETWAELPVPDAVAGLVLTGEQARRFCDAGAGIKVRLTPTGAEEAKVTLLLSLETAGSQP